MKRESRSKVFQASYFLKIAVFFAAFLSSFIGFSMLLAACGGELILGAPDPLLGLSAWLTLLIGAMLCLSLAAYLFVGRNLTVKGIALLWMGSNFFIYGLGMLWVQRLVPCPVVVLTAWSLGIWPATLNLIWEIFIGILMVGGILVLILGRRRSRQLAAPESAQVGKAERLTAK